jgi:Kinesin motor domain
VLSDGKKKDSTFIPYRNSKLTRLLKDSLGGQTPVLMIVCLSPNSCYIDETMNSIKYAQKAKKIKECPSASLPSFTASIGPGAADRMLKQKLRIDDLEREVKNLREQLSKAGGSAHKGHREEQRRPLLLNPASMATLPILCGEEDFEEMIDTLADDQDELNNLNSALVEIDKTITMVDGKIMAIQDDIGSSAQFDSTQQLYKELKELADILEFNLDLKEETIQKIDQQMDIIYSTKLALKKMFKNNASTVKDEKCLAQQTEINRYSLEQSRQYNDQQVPQLNTNIASRFNDPMISSHRDSSYLRQEISKRDAQIAQLTQTLKNLTSLSKGSDSSNKENIDNNIHASMVNLKKKTESSYLSGSIAKQAPLATVQSKMPILDESTSTMSSLVSKLLDQYRPADESESPQKLHINQVDICDDQDDMASNLSFRSKSEDIMELELGIVSIEQDRAAVDYQKLDYYSANLCAGDRVNETNPMSIFSSGQGSHNSMAIKDLSSNDVYLREQLLNLDSCNRCEDRSEQCN